jgi:hypothetical protein
MLLQSLSSVRLRVIETMLFTHTSGRDHLLFPTIEQPALTLWPVPLRRFPNMEQPALTSLPVPLRCPTVLLSFLPLACTSTCQCGWPNGINVFLWQQLQRNWTMLKGGHVV